MATAQVNGISLHFEEFGSGEPIILVTGSGARGRTWRPHQVPALTAAGYRVITVDNRGIPPTECPAGFTLDDMAADVASLIDLLGLQRCRVVGFSLGAIMMQELLLAYPGLVTQAVLIATRGRSDALRTAMSAAEAELADSGLVLPPRYAAIVRVLQNLARLTQDDDERIRDWLDIFEMSPPDPGLGRGQLGLEQVGNRLEDYRKIQDECLVIAFQDDVIAPPLFGREVADSIPASRYREIAGCGHFGHLENPAAVNAEIIRFFQEPRNTSLT